jgi:hypothetical protein
MSACAWVIIGVGCPAGILTGNLGWILVLLAALAAIVLVAGLATAGGPERRIQAGVLCDAAGVPRVFTLSCGSERATLDPGKAWVKADEHKWVTRGLIEPPQSFHVLPDGTVEINGEKIALTDPEGPARLEREINKHHTVAALHKPPPAAGPAWAAPRIETGGVIQAHFKVKLDHLGHLMIECTRGAERVETGLRGLSQLVSNGLMLKPRDLHVDPLQRAVEIDGARFECSEAGAHALQEALNTRYASSLKPGEEHTIDVKENAASPTGFDIAFVTLHAGVRHEVRGHLSQDKLDLLQDSAKSDLLRPGILLRLSPPFLLFRQRRPDGGEERIEGVPDVEYLRATAAQLQQAFNHPSVRRSAAGVAAPAPPAPEPPAGFVQMRLVRNPKNPTGLWLESFPSNGRPAEGRAFTHHNIADLQHRGVFAPSMDVSLSLDHRKLSVLNTQTGREEHLEFGTDAADAVLAEASRMLTAALGPASA